MRFATKVCADDVKQASRWPLLGHNLFGIVQNEDENGVPDPTQPSVFVMDLHSGRAFTLGQVR